MASLYSTKVSASGGRRGSIRSEDGLLDLKLALPRALGGRGDATNPEQLFAGGYAACFENALLHVSRDAGHRFADADRQSRSPRPPCSSRAAPPSSAVSASPAPTRSRPISQQSCAAWPLSSCCPGPGNGGIR